LCPDHKQRRIPTLMTKNKLLQILGAFLSFYCIFFGLRLLIPDIVSDTGTHLTDTGSMIVHASGITYYITFANYRLFAVANTIISAGLTFLWFQWE